MLGTAKTSILTSAGARQPSAPTLANRLEQQERWLSARIEAIRVIKPALNSLFSVLSDDQKEAANDLLGPQIGVTHMMVMPGRMQPKAQ